jgi:hypothetical protein
MWFENSIDSNGLFCVYIKLRKKIFMAILLKVVT